MPDFSNPLGGTIMNRMSIGLLCLSFVLACLAITSAQEAPAPGASSYLAGTAESFLASCRSDLEDARKRIEVLKASPSPRDAMATLQGFDTATLVVGDALARAGLAEQVASLQTFSRRRRGV
jgi:hypothetical protein